MSMSTLKVDAARFQKRTVLDSPQNLTSSWRASESGEFIQVAVQLEIVFIMEMVKETGKSLSPKDGNAVHYCNEPA